MVAGRHHLGKERFSAARIGVEHLQALRKDILIAYAPDVRKGYFMAVNVLTVDDFLTVMREEIAHIVEITVATV